MNKKLDCQGHQVYSKMLRKICKKYPGLNFIRVIKKPSLNQSFVHI